MKGMARQKVHGGKLLCVKIEYEKSIDKIQILGDFFVYPEESLWAIEDGLIGVSINTGADEIARIVEDIAKAQNAEMIGITPAAIAQTILMAVTR